MTQKQTEESQINDQQMQREYRLSLSKETRDFMRNGDIIILKRILFKMFTHLPVNERFKQEKAKTLLLLLIGNNNVVSRLQ